MYIPVKHKKSGGKRFNAGRPRQYELTVKQEKEKLILSYKKECSICGYNKCLSALEFHHLKEKEGDISKLASNGASLEKFKKELNKCICVCANCHREIHENMHGEETVYSKMITINVYQHPVIFNL